MAVDLYLRITTDPHYDDNEIEVDVDIQNFLQQIEMILTTRKGDVLGDPEFGANLEDYVWSNYSSSEIETEISRQISLYCSELSFRILYKIDVSFVQGEIYDTILVDVSIDGIKMLGVVVTP
jgi:hypothetical protein